MGLFRECPRCGTDAFEKLQSYAHCVECLYYEDYWEDPESDLYQALIAAEEMEAALESLATDAGGDEGGEQEESYEGEKSEEHAVDEQDESEAWDWDQVDAPSDESEKMGA